MFLHAPQEEFSKFKAMYSILIRGDIREITQNLLESTLITNQSALIWIWEMISHIARSKINFIRLLKVLPSIKHILNDEMQLFYQDIIDDYANSIQTAKNTDIVDIYLIKLLNENNFINNQTIQCILTRLRSDETYKGKFIFIISVSVFYELLDFYMKVEFENFINELDNNELERFYETHKGKIELDNIEHLSFSFFEEENVIIGKTIDQIENKETISGLFASFIPFKWFKSYNSNWIQLACYYGQINIINQLIDINFNLLSTDIKYHSIQDYLVVGGHRNIAIELNIDLNTRNQLKYAILSNQKDVIDEVLNEELIDHALYYSIKYNNSEVEEKCINMKRRIRFKKSYTISTLDSCGLKNNGYLCYLNSVFHFIYSAKNIKDLILFENETNLDKINFVDAIKSVFLKLQNKTNSFIHDSIILDLSLFKTAEEAHKQIDACEVLIRLLSQMPRRIKTTFIFLTFDPLTKKALPNTILFLNVQNEFNTIEDMILDEDLKILSTSQYLIVSINRFGHDTDGSYKKYDIILPNLLLNLSKKSFFNGVDILYKRHSAIVHIGRSVNEGHYYTLTNNDDVSNRKYDDSLISEESDCCFTSKTVLKNSYILLYIRIGQEEYNTCMQTNKYEFELFKETSNETSSDNETSEQSIQTANSSDDEYLVINLDSNDSTNSLDTDLLNSAQSQAESQTMDCLSDASILSDLIKIMTSTDKERFISTMTDYITSLQTINNNRLQETASIIETPPFFPSNKLALLKYAIINEHEIKLTKFADDNIPDDLIIYIPEKLMIESNTYDIIGSENDLFADYDWKCITINNPKIMKKKILKSLKTERLVLSNEPKIKIYGSIVKNLKLSSKSARYAANGIIYNDRKLIFAPNNLDNIQIESVLYIGRRSFNISLSKVQSIKFPDSLEIIMEKAFAYCVSLVLIQFNEQSSLIHIKRKAFYKCTSLVEFYSPKKLCSLGESAFEFCKINRLKLNEGLQKIGSQCFNHNNINLLVVPESVKEIRDFAFSNNQIFELKTSNDSKLEIISPNAFNNNQTKVFNIPRRLKKIVFPSLFNNIKREPFSYNIHGKVLAKQDIINKVSKIAVINSHGLKFRNNDIYHKSMIFTCSHNCCPFNITCTEDSQNSYLFKCIQYSDHKDGCYVDNAKPLKAHLDYVIKNFLPKCAISNYKIFMPNINQLCGGGLTEKRVANRIQKLFKAGEFQEENSWCRLPSLISLAKEKGGNGFIKYDKSNKIKYVGMIPEYARLFIESDADFGLFMADGTFLSFGVLIIIASITGNHDALPVGWVWSQTEEKVPIMLILDLLKKLCSFDNKTFLTDEAKAFKSSINSIFPGSILQNCAFHIFDKFSTEVRSKLYHLITIDNYEQFHEMLNMFQENHPREFQKIEKKMPFLFSFCSDAKKMGLTTTALIESLNAKLRFVKCKDPLEVFEAVYAHGRNIIHNLLLITDNYTPWFNKRIWYTLNKANSQELVIEPIVKTMFKVKDLKKNATYTISFTAPLVYFCSCGKFLKRGFPCSHASAIINGYKHIGKTWPIQALIHGCYKTKVIQEVFKIYYEKTNDYFIDFELAVPSAFVQPYELKKKKKIRRTKSIREVERLKKKRRMQKKL